MHLIQRYSLSTGLKIDNPSIVNHFFPIDAEKYVVFHASAKDNLRDYDYWHEVLKILQPLFKKLNLKTIQIGFEKDPKIDCDIDLRGKTSIHETAFVIKNSEMLIGVDSFPAHLAGFYNKPLVTIHANSYAACCRPYWGDFSKQRVIETHRADGEKPSFSFHEEPKTINRIKPSEIAAEVCDILDSSYKDKIPEIIFIGSKYKQNQIEIIPETAASINHPNLFVRMDLEHHEHNLNQILNSSPAVIVTSRPFFEDEPELLNKTKIKSINYVADSFNDSFIKTVKSRGIPLQLICTSKENLQKNRAKYFDQHIALFDREAALEIARKKLDRENFNPKKFNFASHKKIIKGNIYNTLYEANQSKNEEDFLLDLDYIMIYDSVKNQ